MANKYYKTLLKLYAIEEAAGPVEVGQKADAFRAASNKDAVIKGQTSGKQHATHFHNAILKGTHSDMGLKKQLYNNLPPNPGGLKVVNSLEQMAGDFIPHIVQPRAEMTPSKPGEPAKPADPNKVGVGQVHWMTPDGPMTKGLTVGGELAQGTNYITFREWLADHIAEKEGTPGGAAEVKGQSPFAGESTFTLTKNENGTWTNEFGDTVENPWFPWVPEDMNEIYDESRRTQDLVEGVTLRNIFRTITDHPAAFSTGDLLTFKREMRGGYDPTMSEDAQKEIYSAYKDALQITSMIREDGDVKYIDEGQVTKASLETIDSFTVKGSKLYVGRDDSDDGRKNMPLVYDMLDGIHLSTGKDSNLGVTIGKPANGIGKALKDVVVRMSDGTERPLIRPALRNTEGEHASRMVSTAKEGVIAGFISNTIGLPFVSEDGEEINSIGEFVESVQKIAEFADMMTNGVPVGAGLINGEEPESALESMIERAGITDIGEAAKEIIRQSMMEANIISTVLADAGVKVVSVGGVRDVSKMGKREDFTVELSSPEDYTKLNAHLQDTYGIALQVDKSLPISLKAYFSDNSQVSVGRTNVSIADKSYLSTLKGGKAGDMLDEAMETHQVFNDFVKDSPLMVDMPKGQKSRLTKELSDAAKVMSTFSTGIASIFSQNTVAKGHTPDGIIRNMEDLLYDPDSGISTEEAQKVISSIKSTASTKLDKGNSSALAIRTIRRVIGRDKSMLKGMAVNDLVSTMFTSHDEAIIQSHAGKVGFSGRHQAVAFLINKCEPRMLPSGNINWEYTGKDGKPRRMYTTRVRPQDDAAIFDGRATSKLFQSVGKVLSGSDEGVISESRKKDIILKLEKILEGIDKVFSVER